MSDERFLWRAQVLPAGQVEHRGRTLNFTREYLGHVATAFRESAFDFVPLMAEPSPGQFTYDPACQHGIVRGMEVVSDGLDLVAAVDAEADEMLTAGLWPSPAARIIEDYRRADGHLFPVAIQMVLLTRSPSITGLRQWVPLAKS